MSWVGHRVTALSRPVSRVGLGNVASLGNATHSGGHMATRGNAIQSGGNVSARGNATHCCGASSRAVFGVSSKSSEYKLVRSNVFPAERRRTTRPEGEGASSPSRFRSPEGKTHELSSWPRRGSTGRSNPRSALLPGFDRGLDRFKFSESRFEVVAGNFPGEHFEFSRVPAPAEMGKQFFDDAPGIEIVVLQQ